MFLKTSSFTFSVIKACYCVVEYKFVTKWQNFSPCQIQISCRWQLDVDKIMRIVIKRAENIVRNGENAGNNDFLHFPVFLTLSQKTNFRLFQTESVCRQQFWIWWKWWRVLQQGRKHCGKKEKLLITSNFSFTHSVFKRLVLQTLKNQDLFGKGIKGFPLKVIHLFTKQTKQEGHWPWSAHLRLMFCVQNTSKMGFD